eukprot:CAMPEP_0171911540 /NCGR_PEP_ID=MMETSP0993-20121228/10359_1 /TAXON_ID=483369 /ORGANISM="non described non described, Strain CCMP2098" /LENGTH=1206 /DNA_ID=CAMNT_0012545077 /DNA_START=28 /DNA_END=3644 /DNA_ORIENTATION=+
MSSKAKKAGKTAEDKKELPRKEQELFKSIAKHYETKQYKKGVKAADVVLKRFPDHGETQAMKALCLSCLDKKEEAYVLVKEALRNDMRSHVCWHVQGLLHRSDKEYLKAIRAYKQALKNDPGNMLILKDNSLLQVQMRDLKGFVETRRRILVEKPSTRVHWLAFALAHHLNGDLKVAVEVLDQYAHTLGPGVRVKDYEESELVMYRNSLLEQLGDPSKALEHLEANEDWVVDQHAWKTKRAELLLLQTPPAAAGEDGGGGVAEALATANLLAKWPAQVKERFAEGRKLWKSLMVDYGFENYHFHRGYMCALLELPPSTCSAVLKLKALDLAVPCVVGSDELTDEQRAVLVQAYAALKELKPRSRAVQRIPLSFLAPGTQEHSDCLAAYVIRMVKDGMPALAADLSGLYTANKPRRLTSSDGSGQNGETVSGKQVGGATTAVTALMLSDSSDQVCGKQASSHPQRFSNNQPQTKTTAKKSSTTSFSSPSFSTRCKDPSVVASHPVFLAVLKLATELLSNLKATGTLGLAPPTSSLALTQGGAAASSQVLLPPTCELWLLYLLAQLEEARGEFGAALAFIDQCIAHTPTAVDMYERRGRLLRKMGDIQGASEQMEVARRLDLQDRYINNKSTKYLMRIGKRSEGLATIGLFTKHDGDVSHNLKDMQVLWALNEYASSASQDKQYGEALKKWLQVETHFEDFVDDQFDFHSYCLRKGTLRSYSSALLMTDTLPHHVAYQRALCGLVATYVELHDMGHKERVAIAKGGSAGAADGSGGEDAGGGDNLSGLSAAERKKAKMLARKAKAKQDKAVVAAAAGAATDKKKEGVDEEKKEEGEADEGAEEEKKESKFPPPPPSPVDPDPLGLSFLKALVSAEDLGDAAAPTTALVTSAAAAAAPAAAAPAPPAAALKKTTALAEASRCVGHLLQFAPRSLTTHTASFDVSCRKGKLLLALKALLAAHHLSPNDPHTFLRLTAFAVGCRAAGILTAQGSPPSSSSAAAAAAGGAVVVAPPAGATAATQGAYVCANEVCAAGVKLLAFSDSSSKACVEALAAELKGLLLLSSEQGGGGEGEEGLVRSFASRHATCSLPHAVACARAAYLVAAYGGGFSGAAGGNAAADYVVKGGTGVCCGASPAARKGSTVSACQDAHAVLTCDLKAASPELAAAWKSACEAAWPLSLEFGSPLRPVSGDAQGVEASTETGSNGEGA